MPVKQKEVIKKFNLITGEETYAGQNAQNPATARRLLSLIPSVNGELVREKGEPTYLPTNLGAKVGQLFQYDYNDTSGILHSKRFAATATQLYVENGGAWTVVTLPKTDGTTSTSALTDYPVFQVINNLLHFSDGAINWLYDGPNDAFVLDGFLIPPFPPNMVNNGGAGTFTALIGRYYWMTWADQTTGRVHESSSSPISGSTGPVTNKVIQVNANNILISTVNGNTTATATSGTFFPSMVGMNLYINGAAFGRIATYTDATHVVLANPAPSTQTSQSCIIAPPRATHIHFYASEEDGSKLGKFLVSIPVTNNPSSILDQAPFQSQAGTQTILNIERPIRNDPAPASKIIEAHKYRLFRRRETIPNRFNYTANEEVAAGANGSSQESVPGADASTLSDILNETAYPKNANAIRALKSHGDALYIATEKEIIPLWGDTIGEFALSQVTAVDGGAISREGLASTAHGLSILSYDRKMYLYPPVSPIYAVVPEDLNITDQLVEIGRSMRNKFLSIKASDIQNVRTLPYRYNTRDWLVVAYQDTNSLYHTYVYDFETKGWFELQRGFVSLAIFETSPGVKILVGGGTDGLVYVVDDLTGAIAPNATLPTATFRTALMDFGSPELLRVPKYLELEVSNPAIMDSSTTVNFYLDPQDVDNLPTPIALSMFPVPGEPTRYRGFFSASEGGQGVLCRRLMMEFSLLADTNAGSFRGIVLMADPVSGMMR